MAAGRERARLQPHLVLLGYGFEKLHAASEEVSYELGQGLPGLAWAKGQPLQLDDIRDSAQFDRAVAAQRAGVSSACRARRPARHRHGAGHLLQVVEVMGGGIGIQGDRGSDVRIFRPAAVDARWPAQELTAGRPGDGPAHPARRGRRGPPLPDPAGPADMEDVAVTVEVAGDGEQAVQRLARSRSEPPGPPQLVLLDLKMPRMDGLEVLRLGASWFVCKPTDGRRLRSEIQQLAHHRARFRA